MIFVCMSSDSAYLARSGLLQRSASAPRPESNMPRCCYSLSCLPARFASVSEYLRQAWHLHGPAFRSAALSMARQKDEKLLLCRSCTFRQQPAANAEEMTFVYTWVRLVRTVRPWLLNVLSLPLTCSWSRRSFWKACKEDPLDAFMAPCLGRLPDQ